ncbi:MAG: N-acetylmuramoyl-L-alanine amidase [Hoeflea sp.]|uniref:N-acetylmuramoyl-L-alanine amidase n=1 Tax=Hoeflea sp. TaxID=1940281 RepID=UPI0032EBF34A
MAANRNIGSLGRVCGCIRKLAFSVLVGLGVGAVGIVSASAQSAQEAGETDGKRLVAVGARMAGDENRVRIVLEFQQDPDYAVRYLAAPYRAVIDLPQTVFAFEEPSLSSRGLVSSVRYGSAGQGRARIVFELAKPARLEPFEGGGETSGPLHRLVFDAVAIDDEDFLRQVDGTVWTPLGAGDDQASVNAGERETLNIMIDPGHGGIDGGAEGPAGTLEKTVTLAFAEAFRKALEELDDVRVSQTRTDDNFLSLSARVRKAREEDADLLVSLHADSIRIKSLRGATVYTLSDRASDAIAQAVAEKENAAEEIVGVKLDKAPEDVASILVDLARNETRVFSNGLARQVIDSFEGQVRLINNPLRHAGFQVLQAPDVPSVLIELGYLSNREDEKMLTDADWQEKTAELLAQSVVKYRQTILAGQK